MVIWTDVLEETIGPDKFSSALPTGQMVFRQLCCYLFHILDYFRICWSFLLNFSSFIDTLCPMKVKSSVWWCSHHVYFKNVHGYNHCQKLAAGLTEMQENGDQFWDIFFFTLLERTWRSAKVTITTVPRVMEVSKVELLYNLSIPSPVFITLSTFIRTFFNYLIHWSGSQIYHCFIWILDWKPYNDFKIELS